MRQLKTADVRRQRERKIMMALVRGFAVFGATVLALSAWNAGAVELLGLGLDRSQLPGQADDDDDDDDDDDAGANEFTITLQLPVMHTDNANGTKDDRRSSLLFAPSIGLEWEHAIGSSPLSLSVDFGALSSRYGKVSSADAGELSIGARLQYDVGNGRNDQRPVFYVAAERTYDYDRKFSDRGDYENEYTIGMDFAIYRDRAGRPLPASADSTGRATWMYGLPVALSREEGEATTLTLTPNVNYTFNPRWDFDFATELAWARSNAEADEDDEDEVTRERTFSLHPVATLTYWFPRGLFGAKARLHLQAGYTKVHSNEPDNSSHTWEIGPVLRLEW